MFTGSGDSWGSALVSGSTLAPGHAYFLSKDFAGKLTETPPVMPGNIRKVVLLALDEQKALVTNYIGHEIPDESIITNLAFSNRKLVVQKNNFLEGDVVRFDPTAKYGLTGPLDLEDTSVTYSDGTYVRSFADSLEDAETLGIVTDTNVAGDPDKFFVTTSGFFVLENGLTAINEAGLSAGVTAGVVYYLNSGATSYGSVGLNIDEPSTAGQVSKPLIVTTGTNSGYFVNYRGVEVTNTSAAIIGSRAVLQETTEQGFYPGNIDNSQAGAIDQYNGGYVATATIDVGGNNTFSYARRKLNSEVLDTNSIVELVGTNGQFNLPRPGKYIIRGWYSDLNTNVVGVRSDSQLRLVKSSNGSVVHSFQPKTYNPQGGSSTFEGGMLPFSCFVEVPANSFENVYEFQHGFNYAAVVGSLGFPHNTQLDDLLNNTDEVYMHVEIEYVGLN